MNEWKIVPFKKKRSNVSGPDSLGEIPPWRRNTKVDKLEEDCIPAQQEPEEKINEPCWFYNTIGCKNKDGSEKSDKECKYLHIKSTNVKRPTHLIIKRPCDKYNLEGSCKWGECCKYSHKPLEEEDWSKYYPNIPFSVRINIQKRQVVENRLMELESRIKILEYKIKCMDEYIENISIPQ